MTRRLKGAAFAGMLGFAAMSFLNAAAYGEPGVFDDRIVFGQSAAFDGPAAALGLGMREGILAAFNEANAASGISGHKLELVSHDDSYDPEKTIANTKRLIDQPHHRHVAHDFDVVTLGQIRARGSGEIVAPR